MNNTVYMKKGDTFPTLETVLKDENGPVRLVGATIVCRISDADTRNVMTEGTAEYALPHTGDNLGKCSYDWGLGGTENVGRYLIEWHVTFANGKEATFPRSDNLADFNILVVQQNI